MARRQMLCVHQAGRGKQEKFQAWSLRRRASLSRDHHFGNRGFKMDDIKVAFDEVLRKIDVLDKLWTEILIETETLRKRMEETANALAVKND